MDGKGRAGAPHGRGGPSASTTAARPQKGRAWPSPDACSNPPWPFERPLSCNGPGGRERHAGPELQSSGFREYASRPAFRIDHREIRPEGRIRHRERPRIETREVRPADRRNRSADVPGWVTANEDPACRASDGPRSAARSGCEARSLSTHLKAWCPRSYSRGRAGTGTCAGSERRQGD